MNKSEQTLTQEEKDSALIAYYSKRRSDLNALQENYIPIYDELAIFADPRNAYFKVKRTPGDLSQLVAKTDDTLQSALPVHAAVMNSLLTPAAYLWHQLRFADANLQEQYGSQLDAENSFIYNKRYSAGSNFVCAINTAYINNAVYGWNIMEVTKDLAKKQVSYRCLPIREFLIEQNERGFVDTFYRRITMTYRHLKQLFPDYIPKSVVIGASGIDSYDKNWLNKTMELWHVVEPSYEKPNKFDSVYIDKTEGVVIKKTLENSPKYICSRAATFSNSNDPYGFSPVMSILPSVKDLNAVAFDLIKATHHASRYDLLAGDDIINRRNYPDVTSIINGGIDSDGRPQVSVLNQRDMPTLDYMINGWKKTIKDALFVDLYISMQDTQSRSATDAMLKANERANIVAPMGDRLIRELLQPLIEIELRYYAEMGVLPPFPEELKGASIDVVLDNPMLRGQRLDSANAISGIAETLNVVKSMEDEFNVDRTKGYLATTYNVPLHIFNTDEEKMAVQQAAAEQAQQAMLVENANKIGAGLKDVAELENPNGGAQ